MVRQSIKPEGDFDIKNGFLPAEPQYPSWESTHLPPQGSVLRWMISDTVQDTEDTWDKPPFLFTYCSGHEKNRGLSPIMSNIRVRTPKSPDWPHQLTPYKKKASYHMAAGLVFPALLATT
jgi:hypothetical protein